MLVKIIDHTQRDALREQFSHIDTDSSGLISAEELKESIRSSQMSITEEQVNHIIDRIDYNKNNQINYTEFLVATIDVESVLKEENVQQLFNIFDTD